MHVIVTGAAGALGREVVGVLAAAGYELTGVDITNGLDSVEGLSHRLNNVDLGMRDHVERAFKKAVSEAGPIEGLVNIAGGFEWETIADGDANTWDRLYSINVRSAVNASHAAIPHLAEGASIVNIGAAAALKAGLGMGPYAAAKSAVARLTETLAEELKDRHVRVNAVLPSIIDTPANRKEMPDADFSTWVTGTELANVIAFLLSRQASAITGALIPVVGRV